MKAKYYEVRYDQDEAGYASEIFEKASDAMRFILHLQPDALPATVYSHTLIYERNQ